MLLSDLPGFDPHSANYCYDGKTPTLGLMDMDVPGCWRLPDGTWFQIVPVVWKRPALLFSVYHINKDMSCNKRWWHDVDLVEMQSILHAITSGGNDAAK